MRNGTGPHREQHFTAGDFIRDVVIGMSDGLTVPFALAAGLSGAVAASSIVVTAGVAELAAGSIAMGLGGYLAAKSDIEHYAHERQREEREVREVPEKEMSEIVQIARSMGMDEAEGTALVGALSRRPQAWVDMMMRLELGLEKPEPRRAPVSAVTIGGAYVLGGAIPLFPYFMIPAAQSALLFSVAFTLIALLIFGALKGHFTGSPVLRSAVQTLLIGSLAAAAAFLIARAIA